MHRSPPLKPAIMLGLATAAVELPFLATCLLVQLFRHCDHCRHEWLSWPVLSGVVPWYIATFALKLFPPGLSMLQIRCVWGVFTACLIALVFALSWRSTLWLQLLTVSLVVSAGLALLAFGVIAA